MQETGSALRPTVVSVSSGVTWGTVGNAATVPGLEASGCRVLALPTVILSNHPGLGRPQGLPIPPERLQAMLATLSDLGALAGCAAIVTGYFTSPEQIDAVADRIAVIKAANPALVYVCDPILGDDHTGLYVPEPVATALRDRLVPMADLIVPNRFELAWLAGRSVTGVEEAAVAATALGGKCVLVTSLPAAHGNLQTALVGPATPAVVTTRRRASIPHGTGDLLTGLVAGLLATGHSPREALGPALAMLERVLDASEGAVVLDLAPLRPVTRWPAPLSVRRA